MAKIIGLTGGIGSGKTTVAKQFAALGVPVYIADDAGKKVLKEAAVITKIRAAFGDAVLIDGAIDRERLSRAVFDNPEQLQRLNNIIHPMVQRDFEQWLERHQHQPFVIKEAAILFESGSYKQCDKIITVTAPLEDRIDRVVKRDATTAESVLKRVRNQWSDDQRIAASDYIINNTDPQKTSKQIEAIHAKLTNL